jgi:transcriptional regulator with XRE-family HTH domain
VTYISGIERGRRNPTLSVLGRLASALEMPLSDLLSRIESEAHHDD